MHTLCTKKCDGCRFSVLMTGTNTPVTACYYLVLTGSVRPCPAGDECTVYQPGGRTGRRVQW